jgi:DNA polymerase III epsilon subunit-like protein
MTFDTETTGLEAGSRMVEIHSALLGDDLAVVDEFHALVNPGMPMPPDATAIHGITDAMLAGAKDAQAVLDDWLFWLVTHDVTVGLAHFAPFDQSIITWECGRFGLSAPSIQVVDTCDMAKAIKATPNNKLDTLVEHYGIERQGDAHRARSDSLAVRDYFAIAKGLTEPKATAWASSCRYPATLPKSLEALPKLIAAGDPFEFGYVDAKGVRTDRAIIPYGWAETDKGVNFHGLCLLRKERRTFLADRIAA